jgi:2-C-methyl-D-erythritol 4-phosphate cytidylyltransferase
MNAVIIAAGGSGTRFCKNKSKLLYDLNNKTVIEQTVDVFFKHPQISTIIITCPANQIEMYNNLLKAFKDKVIITTGGKSRAESVKNGFKAINTEVTNILIHDGARPNVSQTLISNVIKELVTNEVVIPGIPVTDTIKVVKDSQIQETLPRDQLQAVQTPQGFSKQVLNRVYNTLTDIAIYTDEASMTEAIGVNGIITTGCHKNIKITHKDDIAFLNFLNTR